MFDTKSWNVDRVVKEATKMYLNKHNFNITGDFILSQA
jgi:hypothetical protein